jgi:hypothetical protein
MLLETMHRLIPCVIRTAAATLLVALLAALGSPSDLRAQERMVNVGFRSQVLVDSTYNVNWYSQGFTGTFRLEYTNGDGAWKLIDTVSAEQGARFYAWKIPDDTTSRARLRLVQNDTAHATSALFAILYRFAPWINIQRPYGPTLYSGQTVAVVWTLSYGEDIEQGIVSEYSPDAGITWERIDSVANRSSVDSVLWVVPDDTTSTGQIRVRLADSSVSASTGPVLHVRPAPLVRLLQPNGGEAFEIDSVVWIVWNVIGVTGRCTIEYSLDSGAFWYIIETGRVVREGLDSIRWTVAPPLGASVILRIHSDDGPYADTTDGTFQIVMTISGIDDDAATSLAAAQWLPNPTSNGRSTLRWRQETGGDVTLRVYSSDAKLVLNKSLGEFNPGSHETQLDLNALDTGIYHYILTTTAGSATGTVHVQH